MSFLVHGLLNLALVLASNGRLGKSFGDPGSDQIDINGLEKQGRCAYF